MKDKQEFVLSVIREVAEEDFNNEIEWIDTYVDRIKYRNEKENKFDNLSHEAIDDIIHELIFQEKLIREQNDFWIDDKIRPNTKVEGEL